MTHILSTKHIWAFYNTVHLLIIVYRNYTKFTIRIYSYNSVGLIGLTLNILSLTGFNWVFLKYKSEGDDLFCNGVPSYVYLKFHLFECKKRQSMMVLWYLVNTNRTCGKATSKHNASGNKGECKCTMCCKKEACPNRL